MEDNTRKKESWIDNYVAVIIRYYNENSNTFDIDIYINEKDMLHRIKLLQSLT